jgi:hypothetical protein
LLFSSVHVAHAQFCCPVASSVISLVTLRGSAIKSQREQSRPHPIEPEMSMQKTMLLAAFTDVASEPYQRTSGKN